MSDLCIEVAGEPVWLLPERAVFWPQGGTLVTADLHWGKAATFRSAGVPIPGGATGDGTTGLASARTAAGTSSSWRPACAGGWQASTSSPPPPRSRSARVAGTVTRWLWTSCSGCVWTPGPTSPPDADRTQRTCLPLRAAALPMLGPLAQQVGS